MRRDSLNELTCAGELHRRNLPPGHSVRCGVSPDTAFELMRRRARRQRHNIHEYAAEIVASGRRFSAEGEDR